MAAIQPCHVMSKQDFSLAIFLYSFLHNPYTSRPGCKYRRKHAAWSAPVCMEIYDHRRFALNQSGLHDK